MDPCLGSGYIQSLDGDRLIEIAKQADVLIRLRYRPGGFVMDGRGLADIAPEANWTEECHDQLRGCFTVGAKRTPDSDLMFLVSELVEVAARPLSPGVNDPMTAVTCLDWLGAGGIEFATRKLSGAVRLAAGRLAWRKRLSAEHQLRTVKSAERCESRGRALRAPIPLERSFLVLSRLALAATALAAVAGSPAAAQQFALDRVLEAQILLDRKHHSPGVIDGQEGSNTRRAVRAFEVAQGFPVDGKLDPEVMAQLRASTGEPLLFDYTVTQDDVARLTDVPDGMTAQASLEHLGFETASEALAEKFHMSEAFLKRLNPAASFAAGETIRVVRPRSTALATKVARIEVDKAGSEVRAYGPEGTFLASYPGTIGSDRFPSPSGSMEVRAVAPAPTYYFDPSGRDWGPDKRLTIAAGPNNPVGGTWIDLTKEGYGIHGSPDPRLIGKTASHGCVRLTNWDAAELGKAVEKGTTVVFN